MSDQELFGGLRGGRLTGGISASRRGGSAPTLSSSIAQLRRQRLRPQPARDRQELNRPRAQSGWENLTQGYQDPWAEPVGVAPIPDFNIDELAEQISDQVVAEGVFAGLELEIEDSAGGTRGIAAHARARIGASGGRISSSSAPSSLGSVGAVEAQIDALLDEDGLDDDRRSKLGALLRQRDVLMVKGARSRFGGVSDALPPGQCLVLTDGFVRGCDGVSRGGSNVSAAVDQLTREAIPKLDSILMAAADPKAYRAIYDARGSVELAVAKLNVAKRDLYDGVGTVVRSCRDPSIRARVGRGAPSFMPTGMPVSPYSREQEVYGEDSAKPSSEPAGFWRSAVIGAGIGVGFLGVGLLVGGFVRLAR